MNQATGTFVDSKRHFGILDGLRGVAAVMVVLFHILETFTGGDHAKQIINHGYLAVDFFFLLSGYVIGYAYDDRWGKMTLGGFFKRRLIRLHPMIILGMVIGAILFYFQKSPIFPGIENTSISQLLLIFLIGCTLLPVPLSMDIRGWTEMHPLNGPAWSLFYEYVANILYGLIFRRASKLILSLFVLAAGVALIHYAVTSEHGDLIGGWALEPTQIRVGLTRLLYPFFAGLLLSRITKPGNINNAFLYAAFLLILALSLPHWGSPDTKWVNGLYDALMVVFLFPLIVFIGASGDLKEGVLFRISRFLGDISYPLYIIHYPFMYWFMAWSFKNQAELLDGSSAGMIKLVAVATGIFIATILTAYLSLRLYDLPVRKWLTRKFLPNAAGK